MASSKRMPEVADPIITSGPRCYTCAHWTPYRCGLSPHADALPMYGWHGGQCRSHEPAQ